MKFKQYINEASKITVKSLEDSVTGTFHGGIQKVSNLNGKEIKWNYYTNKSGSWVAVLDKADATHIIYPQGKKSKALEL